MCDASNTLQSFLLFWTLHPKQPLSIYCPRHRTSLFPGLWSALQRPHGEASRLDNTIATVYAILSRAKAKCIRDHLLLAESEVQFLQTKLWASKIDTRVLETHDMRWTIYLRNIPSVWKSLANCECELRELNTSMLLLIEAAHQHKLAQDIKESREVVDGVLCIFCLGCIPHSSFIQVARASIVVLLASESEV
ncbi:hypothetical protein B0H14DRAFT_901579 [Mycena olivaceomarginata]|nr:hypothetical protein B0H14DRAFT_901579 [Mycena olivaceomarginata]